MNDPLMRAEACILPSVIHDLHLKRQEYTGWPNSRQINITLL